MCLQPGSMLGRVRTHCGWQAPRIPDEAMEVEEDFDDGDDVDDGDQSDGEVTIASVVSDGSPPGSAPSDRVRARGRALVHVPCCGARHMGLGARGVHDPSRLAGGLQSGPPNFCSPPLNCLPTPIFGADAAATAAVLCVAVVASAGGVFQNWAAPLLAKGSCQLHIFCRCGAPNPTRSPQRACARHVGIVGVSSRA